jgi:hypothetical protein
VPSFFIIQNGPSSQLPRPDRDSEAVAQGSIAAMLAGYVHVAGVRHVFGYPGESVIAPAAYEAEF